MQLSVLIELSGALLRFGIQSDVNGGCLRTHMMATAKQLLGVALMPSLAHYMAQYDHEHESAWNKLLHGVGIPMIFAGMILLIFTKWLWGAGFFVGGWMFLFLGHRIEGNHPAFFQGPIYLLVGPIWVAKETWEFLTGARRRPASERAMEDQATKQSP